MNFAPALTATGLNRELISVFTLSTSKDYVTGNLKATPPNSFLNPISFAYATKSRVLTGKLAIMWLAGNSP